MSVSYIGHDPFCMDRVMNRLSGEVTLRRLDLSGWCQKNMGAEGLASTSYVSFALRT